MKEVFKMLLELESFDRMFELSSMLTHEILSLPLIKFMQSYALAHTGKIEEAEAILLENGGLDIPDIREGENSTSGLYLFIQQEKAKRSGQPFDPRTAAVPFTLDLRMSE